MEPQSVIEVSSDVDDDEFADCVKGDSSDDDDAFPLTFKQNVLENISTHKNQCFKAVIDQEIDPSEVFEIESKQDNFEDYQELDRQLDLLVLELPDTDDGKNEDENKLLTLSAQMSPIQGCDGIFKNITKSGQGACPPPDSVVTIHFEAYIQDEVSNQIKSFDSTFLRGKPTSFTRGQGEAILGLDEAVGTMKRNEQSQFIFSPDWAFGELGCPPRIPPKAYVYFKIDLIDWIDSSSTEAFGKFPKKKRKLVCFEKVLEAAKSEKAKATSLYEKQNFISASKCYRNALNWVQEREYADEEEEKRGQKLCLKLLLNLALVNLKLNRPKISCTYCKEALGIPTTKLNEIAKAHYRYGLAQKKLGDFNMALKSMETARQFSPNDSSVIRGILELKKDIRNQEHAEKNLYRKMLGNHVESTEKFVPQTEESHKAIRRQLAEFVESNEENFSFPQCLSQSERSFLQGETARLNLKISSKTTMRGGDLLVISK